VIRGEAGVGKTASLESSCAAITIGSAWKFALGGAPEVGEDLVRAALDAGQRVVAANASGDSGREYLSRVVSRSCSA
jgi:hypothetical protein